MHDIWNPWHGCHKCSDGCKNCYMYALDNMRDVKIPSDQVYRTNNFDYPLKKNRQKQYKIKPGERIRVNMTSDTFVEEADEWRDEMWKIIKTRSDVQFWLITKRPERVLDHLPSDWDDGYENIMFGVTCENQKMLDIRMPVFKDIPAKHKSLYLAPLLSDIDLEPILSQNDIYKIEEIYCGGENYNNPRPCHYEWVKHISDTCAKYHVNFIWYETGTILYKNDIKYFIPNKSYQAKLPTLSNLNHIFYKLDFKLYDENNQPITEPYEPIYNTKNCILCSNALMCNGCSNCGKCGKDLTMISQQELLTLREKLIKGVE